MNIVITPSAAKHICNLGNELLIYPKRRRMSGC